MRTELASAIVTGLPRYGRWAAAIRDYDTPYGKVGYRQLQVLWGLRFGLIPEKPTTPMAIAAFFTVQPSVVTRALAKLEEGGFIERTVSPEDGRSYHISITQRGIEVSAHVEQHYIEEVLDSIEDLSDAQVDELLRNVELLTTIANRLAAKRQLPGAGVGPRGER